MPGENLLFGDRAVIGLGSLGAPAAGPFTSPLRLAGMPSVSSPSGTRAFVDATTGDLKLAPMTRDELPAGLLYNDGTDQTILGSWTWAAGKVVAFAAGGTKAIPSATGRSIGTRLVIEPAIGSTEHALGLSTSGLWTSVPNGQEIAWYQSNVSRLRMAADGALNLENGSGYLVLNGTSGVGTLWAPGAALGIIAGNDGTKTGYLSVNTGGGLVTPVYGYKEALGQINKKFLSLHAAELWVETLVAQSTLATIGGRILVGPTTTLTRDLDTAATTIYVKHNAFKLHVGGVEFGSKIVFQVAGKFEVMAITSQTAPTAEPAGDYAYTVLRAYGGTANVWYAGDAIFDTGKFSAPAGSFIDLYSLVGVNPGVSTAGPTIVGNLRINEAAYGWRERWAIGNLFGIYGNGATNVIGAAFGPPDGMHLQIDATNGIRMLTANNGAAYGEWRMDGTVRFGYAGGANMSFTPADGALRLQWNGADKFVAAGGDLYLAGSLVLGAWGAATAFVRSANATAWNNGSGFILHSTGAGVATALIGSATGRRLQWTDTQSLRLVSDGLTIDENGIQLQQQNSGSMTPSRAVYWGSTGLRIWDSSTNDAAEIYRSQGNITINSLATNSIVTLQSGGSGVDRVALQLQAQVGPTPGQMILSGIAAGGIYPRFVPSLDNVSDLGRSDLRWRLLYSIAIALNSWIGIGNPAVQGQYQIALSADSATKPVSSTWTVTPSDRKFKRAIASVDGVEALDLVRRVELVRFEYTAEAGPDLDGAPAIGIIAEDIERVLPRSISRAAGRAAWNAHELLMLNVAAVQALAARLDALEGKAADE